MFIQFFTKRSFYIAKDKVKSVVSHVEKDPKTSEYKVGNRSVIELEDKTAKEFLKRYPKEVEGYGKDAVVKKIPTKGKNSKPQGHQGRNLED